MNSFTFAPDSQMGEFFVAGPQAIDTFANGGRSIRGQKFMMLTAR